MEIDIEIDGLTNCLINRKTGEELDTQYRLISRTEKKINPVVCDDFTMTLKNNDSGMQFGEDFPDGRLTEPSDGTVYRLREAVLLSKRLGRPLTEDEMKAFVAAV